MFGRARLRDVLDQIDERVVDFDRSAAQRDHAAYALRLDPGVPVAQACVQQARRVVVAAVAETDAFMPASGRRAFRGQGERRSDALPPPRLRHEDILDLGHAELRARPCDVCLADRLVVVPRNEVRLVVVETRKRQALADALDVTVGQLADVDAATNRRRNVSAPLLSSISFRFPHFGLCTHDGQPSLHGQPSSMRAVSATQPSNA